MKLVYKDFLVQTSNCNIKGREIYIIFRREDNYLLLCTNNSYLFIIDCTNVFIKV